MIGIGVTSNNEERYKLFIEHLEANTSDYKFASINIKGVRKAKNKLLYDLRDCDHIFLFDDDCYPIMDGWVKFMVEALKVQPHFQYNTKDIHVEIDTIKIGNIDVLVTAKSGGVFMAFTKEVLDKVGYMSHEYEGYGWEHLGYAQRIFNAGLTINPYICPVGLDKYLHAEDYVRPMIKELSKEEEEVKNRNELIFRKEAFNINPKRVEYVK